MGRSICYMPIADGLGEARDLAYVEESTRERSLHLLLQDASPRSGDARGAFLRAAFREAVTRYLDPSRPATAPAMLRELVGALELQTRGVDTRLDDYRELGVFVLVRERDTLYLLCPRGASSRMRFNGGFVPIGASTHAWVREVSIESARAQHDLFTPTLPDSLVLYRIAWPPSDGTTRLELLLGGDPDDAGAAVDALELVRGDAARTVTLERVRHAVMYAAFDASVGQRAVDAAVLAAPHARFPPRRATWAVGGVMVLVAVGGLLATKPWRGDDVPVASKRQRVSQESAAAMDTRRAPPAESTPESATPPAESVPAAEGFRLAWEKTYRAAVTSSPSPLGGAIVFGSRDGKVYALDRASGEVEWTFAAAGGVGASPVVQNDAVVAADYAGTVYRLSRRDGRAVWKRALRERVVSTPATDGVRVAVGTAKGNVYALSFDTGRVLWKFATRGQVRGGIAHAGDSYFVPSHDGRLYAIDDDTGARRWAVALGGPVTSSPASDGSVVVVGSARGDIVALDAATGARRWAYTTGGAVSSGVEIEGGRVYAGSSDRFVYCLDLAGGALAWRTETSGVILSKPFVGDGLVVVTSYDHRVYCLDSESGRVLDSFETTNSIFSSPLLVNGRVYFGNNDGRFYCLEAPES